jgi:predicted nucleotidyltransferase component of viral defense system
MINEQALKAQLLTIAKEKGIPFNSCWKKLLLERFLARLSRSVYADNLIFKGGFLLAYMMKIGRETTDLDFLLTRMKAERATFEEICNEIAAVSLDDGFTFSFAGVELLSQPHMDYPGYRITFNTHFEKMRDKIHIDVGVGDVVEPQHREIKLFQYRGKPFFEDIVSLLVYPVETIFAEKLETVLSKGSKNSRMKDYHDLLLLVRSKGLIEQETLKKTLTKTFQNRSTSLSSIQFDSAGIKSLQQLWTAHLHGLGDIAKNLALPKDIERVIEEINQGQESLLLTREMKR